MLVQIAGITSVPPSFLPEPVRQSHVFQTAANSYVLIVDGSRIYAIDAEMAAQLRSDPGNSTHLLEGLSLLDPDRPRIAAEAPESVPVRSLSLAVAQKCNLACTYCYAQEGSFGSEPKNMEHEAALRSVELLFRSASAGESVNLAFLGGEPLVNRPLIRDCTKLAAQTGKSQSVRTNFSITTNGTLLTPDDGRFFEEYGFAVTISLDGIGEVHDSQRSFQSGKGSYARIIENVRPLLAMQRQMQVSARVTVTPGNLRLKDTLDQLLALGFHSVGFSPMLHAPSGRGEMDQAALDEMLAQMIECGETFERRTALGERYAFSNLATAMREIHKGTHRPYPCGAGGGYFGVSADGGLYACHRFVEDPNAKFGDVWNGVDPATQKTWLAQRHVHTQSPCSGCWARYLCGGGCHHEVIHRGRPACDYIRGWLEYCLQAYVRLQASTPEYFA
ncbi:MAG: radical protein [Bryobacterales bacterium]|nr:radical protein [Bryobacterales bacterium]